MGIVVRSVANVVAVFGQELIERIDGVFAAWDSAVSPGCALGIYLNGEIAYGRGYGMSNLEHGIPIDDPEIVPRGMTSTVSGRMG